MKKNIYIVLVAVVAVSCSTMGKSEKSILAYMRDQTGSPKLDIEFANVQITKQTVGDSINILQEEYEKNVKEKAEKTELFEKGVKECEANVKSNEEGSMLFMVYSQDLDNFKKQYKHWKEVVVVNEKVRYDGRDKDQVIATLVGCQMTSLINPVLNAKQTKEGTFLLTADESKCIRQLN